MSSIHLKRSILNVVARVEDEKTLREILDFCHAKAKELYPPDGMPPDVLAELLEVVERSYDEKNLTPHEVFKQERQQWLAELRG